MFGCLLQFLTNVFFIPYLALRQFDGSKPNTANSGVEPARLPPYAAAIGVVGAVVGVVSLFWGPLARPEYGGLADRSALPSTLNTNPKNPYVLC